MGNRSGVKNKHNINSSVKLNITGGSTGLEAEKIRLKLTAQESLEVVKKLEQDRINSGNWHYVTSYDQYGKMFRTFEKKNT